MEFVTIHLGGPDLAFVEHNRVRIPFVFPRPVSAAYPLLQSFRFVDQEGDKHLKDVQIGLVPFFNAGVSATQGEVEIETTFKDADGLAITSDLVGMEISVLVVGV